MKNSKRIPTENGIENLAFTEKRDELKLQNNYKITGISIAGNDLEGYEIVRDKSIKEYNDAIERLENFFYSNVGYRLPIVEPAEAGDKTISFVSVSKNEAGPNGFRVRVEGGNLLIECAYNNLFDKAFDEYYNNTFIGKIGEIKLGDFTGKTDISIISYEDFGAVGDGKTDDLAAIRATHTEANRTGQTVVGTRGKTYYVGPTYKHPVDVMTNVDWKGCKFIFDSSALTRENHGHVFRIAQNTQDKDTYITDADDRIIELNKPAELGEPVIKGISHGDGQTVKLDLGLGYPAMLTVINSSSKNYIRWGFVDSKGEDQQEVILVDKDGNIDPSTPFLLDYEKVTSITVHKIDVEPITIQNATVCEYADRVNLLGKNIYCSHGIVISRPNTVVKNITHVIEGEIPSKAPVKVDENGLSYDVTSEGFSYSDGKILKNGEEYTGDDVKPFSGPSFLPFIRVVETHNALVEDCVFQSRVKYLGGTYDLGAQIANQIVFKNCTQSNFFDTREKYTKYNNGQSTCPNLSLCWGIMGTNYTKNVHYVDCELTRFDAHAGLFNGSIVGGKIGILCLIGGGNFLIEGVEVYTRYRGAIPFHLREDYGATFFGTITVKDVVIKDGKYSMDGKYGEFNALFDAQSAPWDNGYVNHFPNIIIDNISVETTDTEIDLVNIGGQTYSQSSKHYPSRSIIKEDVSNPDALITTYYETKNPNVVEEDKERFYYLKGFKKVDKAPEELSNGEYTAVDNKNGTYTVIANGVKNINPYQPPEFIEILNMKDAKNIDGKPLTIKLYDCKFFNTTEIRDTDKVLKRVKVPE